MYSAHSLLRMRSQESLTLFTFKKSFFKSLLTVQRLKRGCKNASFDVCFGRTGNPIRSCQLLHFLYGRLNEDVTNTAKIPPAPSVTGARGGQEREIEKEEDTSSSFSSP